MIIIKYMRVCSLISSLTVVYSMNMFIRNPGWRGCRKPGPITVQSKLMYKIIIEKTFRGDMH